MFTIKDDKKYFSDKLKKLLEQNRNIEIKSLIGKSDPNELIDSTGTSLLHLSAKYNNHLLTKYLIKRGSEIGARDNSGATPLLESAMYNSFKSAAALLDANADVCAVNDVGRSPLQLFFNVNKKVPEGIVNRCLERVKTGSNNYYEMADKLMNAGCRLDLVVQMGAARVTKIMLERGLTVDDNGLSAALYLAIKSIDLDNAKVLLEHVGEVSLRKIALFEFFANVAVKKPTKKGLEIINSLLNRVSDWHALDEQHMFFLEFIIENGTKDAVVILLESNVDCHVRSVFRGRELLAHIFANRRVDAIELLQQRSFNVNCRGKFGNTPLKLAVKNRVVGNVQQLLDMNADPNITDDDGWVPLFEALSPKKLEANDKKCVELLLQYGAEIQIVSKYNQTIVDWALVNGDFTILEPVLAHLAILERLGQPILPKIQQKINMFRHLKICYETYCKQLDRMRQYEICPNVTLFTVLTVDSEKIAYFVNDKKNIAVLLQSNAVRRFHWYYVSTLKKRFEQAMEIVILRNKAAEIIAISTERFHLKYCIINKIVGYLNYEDLYMFA
ncbi:ankyrin-3-like [Phymastichus coffea]|uniref:ankyrin-3-like n=1 Tax=Phymastichus coffea TaxID=108790 RepID=UPI00273A8689|nr:ankyrin-3-like [Phymastichus coffea]